MAIPAGKYTIKSATGPYLGMNGSGIIGPFSSGVASLFCSNDSPSNPALQFYITPVAEDTNIYTIQSVAFPGVYLRMDGFGLDWGIPILEAELSTVSLEWLAMRSFGLFITQISTLVCSRSVLRLSLLSPYVLTEKKASSTVSLECTRVRCSPFSAVPSQ